MASYGTGNVTQTSFVFYGHGFSGDKTRFMQVVVNNRVKFSGTINSWESDPYYGQMTISGLTPNTDYTIKVYIGTSTIYSNNTLDRTLYVTTKAEELTPFRCTGATITLNSYASNIASITIDVEFYNPNNKSSTQTVYIYGEAYYDDNTSFTGNTTTRSLTLSSYSYGTVSRTYSSWYISTNQFPVTFYACGYSKDGSERCFSEELTRNRPDKFYWISSSTRLNDASHKGKPISDYITATKWKALQTNVNAVRVYRGLSNYSFTTNITSGVTPITAALYNEIANAINGIKSGTVSTVTKGVTPITTSVMMALQDGINGIT